MRLPIQQILSVLQSTCLRLRARVHAHLPRPHMPARFNMLARLLVARHSEQFVPAPMPPVQHQYPAALQCSAAVDTCSLQARPHRSLALPP